MPLTITSRPPTPTPIASSSPSREANAATTTSPQAAAIPLSLNGLQLPSRGEQGLQPPSAKQLCGNANAFEPATGRPPTPPRQQQPQPQQSRIKPYALEDLPAWRLPLLQSENSFVREVAKRLRDLQSGVSDGSIDSTSFVRKASDIAADLKILENHISVWSRSKLNDDIGLQYTKMMESLDGDGGIASDDDGIELVRADRVVMEAVTSAMERGVPLSRLLRTWNVTHIDDIAELREREARIRSKGTPYQFEARGRQPLAHP
jgi:hypothetical protein